jgi:hypothetical protein
MGTAGLMDWLDLLQWPAMIIIVAATWLIASKSEHTRKVAFWGYFLGNILWVAWGLHTEAYALVIAQFLLAALNVRGAKKNEDEVS